MESDWLKIVSDIKIIMSQVAVSQVEKHFITNNVYKRSRRYFDISQLNRFEQQQQLSRRTPQLTN